MTGKAVAIVLKQFGTVFSGQMQADPRLENAPPEFPRVILQSQDRRRKLSMGPARIDFAWTADPASDAPPLNEIAQECIDIVEHYASEAKERVGRLGFILRRICNQDDSAKWLIDYFCNDAKRSGPFKRSENFVIENHKKYNPGTSEVNYEINSKVTCRNALKKSNGQPVILAIQDLNTLAEKMQRDRYSSEQIRGFFSAMTTQADKILSVYFPNE